MNLRTGLLGLALALALAGCQGAPTTEGPFADLDREMAAAGLTYWQWAEQKGMIMPTACHRDLSEVDAPGTAAAMDYMDRHIDRRLLGPNLRAWALHHVRCVNLTGWEPRNDNSKPRDIKGNVLP